jgi:Protein of unknown function (DUF3833)
LPVESFADQDPRFDPVAFFTGHVRSWGVFEDRSGQPTGWVATDCEGRLDGSGTLHMTQRLTRHDGSVQTREWQMRRTSPNRVEASANDMVGTAVGEGAGRAFHWRWVLAAASGQPELTLEQWFYLTDTGAMLNRTGISKFGILLAQVTEQF